MVRDKKSITVVSHHIDKLESHPKCRYNVRLSKITRGLFSKGNHQSVNIAQDVDITSIDIMQDHCTVVLSYINNIWNHTKNRYNTSLSM